ncbi:hypothetical protein TNCV_3336051 [Trichonephila clavipes]|nr:hypothetical protein TNCV_3336051 [Trichonephila clavipes]
MPPNTHRIRTEYVLVKSVGPKSSGLSHERRDWKIFPSLQFNAEILELEIGGVAIYHHLGNFAELNRTVTCMVLKANDRCSTSLLPRVISWALI